MSNFHIAFVCVSAAVVIAITSALGRSESFFSCGKNPNEKTSASEFSVSGLFGEKEEGDNGDYLRLHVRANSNDAADQAVKYEIKDEIVCLLTPAAANSKSKEDLMKKLKSLLREIEKTADEVLAKKGFSYKSRAKITREEFPARRYGDLTLEKGEYDALILNLGSGKGDNWWCVVYPPLCFLGAENEQNVKYKSLIAEVIKKWREKKEEKKKARNS